VVIVENEFTTPAPRKVVWRTLTDLERYSAWHPSLRLDGIAEVDGEIGLVQTNTVIGRDAPRVPAKITRFEPERVLEWRMGLRLLLGVTESYELRPHPFGSSVVHRVAYGGLGAAFRRARVAVRAHAQLSNADMALQKHLAGVVEANAPPGAVRLNAQFGSSEVGVRLWSCLDLENPPVRSATSIHRRR
jgi:hypothetical protein